LYSQIAGKDALNLMTRKTTRLLANTQDKRPCICKTTHSMGSKGIFAIHTDQDEEDFNRFLEESGNPTFVVTEFVEIARNVACHFFIHPTGDVTWFGSNENRRTRDGSWSTDSAIVMDDQDYLCALQMPFVQDVVRYCQALGFWGFCGIDVLFDEAGKGYLVDVNPRVRYNSDHPDPRLVC
jgi:biotin carboxylase